MASERAEGESRRRAHARAPGYTLALVAALAIGLFVAWRAGVPIPGLESGPRQAAGPPARPPVAVPAAEAALETWQARLDAVGTLRAVESIDVSTDVPGIVSTIRFRSGAETRRGELLVELDATEELARLEGLRASLARARAALERDRKLAARNFVAEARLDETRTAVQELEAQVAAQRAVIERRRIKAPFAGELGIRRVDRGDFVEPGAALVSLQTIAPIHVDFSLPEQSFAAVAPGQPVRIATDAYPDRVYAGEVATRSPRVDADTRRFDVRATLPNEDRTLRPGMYAHVTVVLPQARQVVAIPATAVRRSPSGDAVFVLIDAAAAANGEGDGETRTAPPPGPAPVPRAPAARTPPPCRQPALAPEDIATPSPRAGQGGSAASTAGPGRAMPRAECLAQRRFVQLGERRGERIAVVSGLAAGERIAVAGLLKLDDGAPVIVVEAPEGAAPARAPGDR